MKSRRKQNILGGRCFNCGAVDLVVEDTLVCSAYLGSIWLERLGMVGELCDEIEEDKTH